MSMGYDPEAIYQDADIEQAELETEGNRLARLKRAGICTHGHVQGTPDGRVKCIDESLYAPEGCGARWDTEEEWLEARP